MAGVGDERLRRGRAYSGCCTPDLPPSPDSRQGPWEVSWAPAHSSSTYSGI